MRSRVGNANSVARPAGIAAAIAAAASGAATYADERERRADRDPPSLCRCGGEADPETRNRSEGKFAGVARFEGDSKRRNDQDHKGAGCHCTDEIEHCFPVEVVTAAATRQGVAQRSFPAARRCSRSSFAHHVR